MSGLLWQEIQISRFYDAKMESWMEEVAKSHSVKSGKNAIQNFNPKSTVPSIWPYHHTSYRTLGPRYGCTPYHTPYLLKFN